MSAKNMAMYIVDDRSCLKSHLGTLTGRIFKKKSVEPYLTISLDTAVLDMSEDEPGGAVAHREHPAGDDDPLGPGQGADVLKIVN